MTLWHRAMFSKRCSAWQRKELLSNQAITWTRGHDGSWMWASAFAARAPLRKVGPRLTVMLENLENWPIYDVAPSSPHEVNTDNLSWILALQLWGTNTLITATYISSMGNTRWIPTISWKVQMWHTEGCLSRPRLCCRRHPQAALAHRSAPWSKGSPGVESFKSSHTSIS